MKVYTVHEGNLPHEEEESSDEKRKSLSKALRGLGIPKVSKNIKEKY